ncbi:HAD family phosphatase [Dactylosporangium sp. NPDC005572]|uniref:HAD family hydrolase n=1 Tax=Dactylosporangium sp. NPDC005572 TaxID=3156889 RepID=UPI0033B2BA28
MTRPRRTGPPLDGGVFDGWMPDGVVFDCDGLLVDTEPCWSVAESELFARRGLPFGVEQKRLLIGKSLAAAGAVLEEAFGEPGQAAAIGAELEALVAEVIADQAQPMPGARTVVDLTAARVPVAVASNSSRRLLDLALRRGSFADTFTVSIAADEVGHPKPAPDLYLEACTRLGIAPARGLAFEDSLTGMRAAVAAGLRLVSVPTLTQPGLPGDWILPSLDHASLIDWITAWPTTGHVSTRDRAAGQETSHCHHAGVMDDQRDPITEFGERGR